MKRILFGLLFLVAMPLHATTWYVRSDGGTRYSVNVTTGQCNGMSDAAWVSGTNQPCAFNDYRYLYTDGCFYVSCATNPALQRAWIIAGGDTVILRNGPWRVGYRDANNTFGDLPGDPFNSTNPTIPAGSSGTHTRILGENWATCGANNKTQLQGGFAVGITLNLAGANFLDVRCLEITDHAQCIRAGTPVFPSTCSTSFPLDDYSQVGIETDNTTGTILLQDLNIHGLVFRGIKGAVGAGTQTVTNVRIGFNAYAGWDFDDGTMSSASSNVVITNLTVEWNGCDEEYPIVHTYPALSCYDDLSGGYGDGLATGDTPLNFSCTQCTFRYNTQDGLDLLHVTSGTTSVTRSQSYGNMGQQYKLGIGTTVSLTNSLAVINCNRMSVAIGDAPATFKTNLSDYCRAAGGGIASSLSTGNTLTMQFNTIVGYSATAITTGCRFAGCTGYSLVFQDNVLLGYSNPSYNSGLTPGFIDWGVDTPNFNPRSYNDMFNMRNEACGFTGEVCTNPLFVNEPSLTMSAESDLDNFNFNLQSGSPAKFAGLAIGGITTDYNNTTRPNPPSDGAFEFGSIKPPGSVVTGGTKLAGGVSVP
jgi:hypothetical protein